MVATNALNLLSTQRLDGFSVEGLALNDVSETDHPVAAVL